MLPQTGRFVTGSMRLLNSSGLHANNALSEEAASKILALLAEAASAAPEGDGPGPG